MTTATRSNFKNYTRRFAFAAVTFFLVLGLMDFGVGKIGNNNNDGTEWAVCVNGMQVSQATFGQNVIKQEENIYALREQGGAYAEELIKSFGGEKAPQRLALTELKQNALLDQLAASIPVHINHTYLENKINNPQFMYQSGLSSLLPLGSYTAYGIDQERLKRYLSRANMTMFNVEHMLLRGLERYVALEFASLGAVIDPSLTHLWQKQHNALGKYALLTFPLDMYIKQQEQHEIKPEALKAFFDRENNVSKRYWVPEQRAGTIWKINPANYGIVVKEDSIQDYYERNKVYKYIKTPAQVEVRALLLAIDDPAAKDAVWQNAKTLRQELTNNPAAFADRAKEISRDEETAHKGGLMAPFAKGQKDPVFERKAFTLTQPQDISEPFETAEGIWLLQLVNKQPVIFKAISEVKSDIEQLLLTQKFNKHFARDFKRLRNDSLSEADVLALVQKAKGTKTIQPLHQLDDSKIMRELFRLKKGQMGILIDNNVGYIVQLTDIQKRHLPELSSVESTVRVDYKRDAALKELKKQIEAAKQALKTESVQKVATEFNARLQETAAVKVDDKELQQLLKKHGLTSDLLLQLEKPGSAVVSIEHDGFILMLVEQQSADTEDDNAEKQDSLRKLTQERKSLFLQGFIASLSRNATIETNQAISTLYEN